MLETADKTTAGNEADASQPATDPNAVQAKLEQLLNDRYFARKPRNEIGSAILGLADTYYMDLERLGKIRLWRRAYRYYYQGEFRGGALKKAGKQSEYVLLPVNHYRNILKHLLNGVTSQPPSPEPQAQNTDFASMAQTIVARGVVQYYDRDKRLGRYTKAAAEMSLVYGEASVEEIWDQNAGGDYMADGGGSTVKEGDLSFTALAPIDVIRDTKRGSMIGQDWRVVRKLVNKFTYAAQYPQFADKIINLSTNWREKRNIRIAPIADGDTDLIFIWTFYHTKTAALPDGRVVELASPDIVTIDGPIPYRRVPVYDIVPDVKEGTPFGYTIGFDILPIQEGADALASTIATNQSNFGVQNIAMPKQANLTVTQIADGLNLIEYNIVGNVPMKPEGLNLTNTPAEIFNFLDKLEKWIETISGVNATVRGNPEASLKSGAALALVSSMAIQFNSDFQQSYAQLLEDVWTGIIETLQDFSSTPRIARITGKANRPLMASFTKDDIGKIQRVAVELGNPLTRTTAGKLQIAEDLLNKGLIRTPDEYLTILSTGRLEPMIEGQQAQILLIRAENERLGDDQEQMPPAEPQTDPNTGQPAVDPTGQPVTKDVSSVPVILTDDHALHIQEHAVVLASPEARQNPNVVKNTLAHLNAHLDALMSGSPLLALNHQPDLAPPAPPLPPSGAGDKAPPPSGAKGTGNMPAVTAAGNNTEKAAAKVNLPNMPKNPLNGQRFDPSATAAGQ